MEISKHQNIRDLKNRTIRRGRVVHVNNIHRSVSRTELARIISDRGFDECTLFWLEHRDTRPKYHKGWCRIVFHHIETARAATVALSTIPLRGQFLRTYLVVHHESTRLTPPSLPQPAPAAVQNVGALRTFAPPTTTPPKPAIKDKDSGDKAVLSAQEAAEALMSIRGKW